MAIKSTLLFLLQLAFVSSLYSGSNNSRSNDISTIPIKEQADYLLKLAKESLQTNTMEADQLAMQAAIISIENQQQEQLALAYKIRGLASYFNNDNDMAIHHYNNAIDLFKKLGDYQELSNTLNNKGLALFNKAQYETAIQLHYESLQIRNELNDTILMIGSLINLGNCFDEIGEFDKASSYFEKALDLSMLKNPENPPSNLMAGLANTLAKGGKLTAALEIFEQAILVAQQNNSYRNLIIIYNNMGNLYYRLGDHEKAINQLNKALEIVRLNNMIQEEASVLLNIGNMLEWTHQFKKANQFYVMAYHSFSSQNDTIGIVKALLNNGLMYEKMSSTDSAIIIYTNAVRISNLYNNPDLIAMSYNSLGKVLIGKGELNKGKNYIEQALQHARINQNIFETAKASQSLSLLHFQEQNYSQSRIYALESLEFFKKIDFVSQQMETILILSEISEKLGNPTEALSYYKTYVVLRDSLFNMNKIEQITAIEEKFNLALKEEEIENQALKYLQQSEQLNRTKERALFAFIGLLFIFTTIIMLINRSRLKQARNIMISEQKQLETEHRLLRTQMNPHFMFNALNSIQSFIAVNNTMEAEIYLSKFASLMRYYLDSSSMSYVPLTTEIENLRLNLELEQLRLSFRFDFKIIVPEDHEDISVPPMLAQPFIENAVRHGFRQKKGQGNLLIQYEILDSTIKCTIEDNGIGRAAATKSRSQHSGKASKGIEITLGRLSALFPKKDHKQLLKITDLYLADGSAAGTKIEFIFPYL